MRNASAISYITYRLSEHLARFLPVTSPATGHREKHVPEHPQGRLRVQRTSHDASDNAVAASRRRLSARDPRQAFVDRGRLTLAGTITDTAAPQSQLAQDPCRIVGIHRQGHEPVTAERGEQIGARER